MREFEAAVFPTGNTTGVAREAVCVEFVYPSERFGVPAPIAVAAGLKNIACTHAPFV